MGDLHNVIDHFTVALLNLGILFELLGYRSKSEGMKSFGWIALRMSLGFAVLSILTGFVTESAVRAMVDEAKPVLAYHKAAGFATVVLLAASVITRLSAKEKFLDPLRGTAVRSVYFTLLVVTFVIGTITGYLGMELTYRYGVHVEPYERILEALPPKVTAPQMPKLPGAEPSQAPLDSGTQLPTTPDPSTPSAPTPPAPSTH
jgi:uncharacterized membrane protein